MEHEGNQSSCAEEVDRVTEIVNHISKGDDPTSPIADDIEWKGESPVITLVVSLTPQPGAADENVSTSSS